MSTRRWTFAFLLIALHFGLGTPLLADSITPSQIVTSFDLGNNIEGEIVLTFENATDLDADSLDISASLVDLSNPCAICARLPQGVFIPARFPVVVDIEPDMPGLAFQGRWSLEIITERLPFTGDTPLRLFQAPDSQAMFRDITSSFGFGSFRVLGTGGSFSQFVIAADQRNPNGNINKKFNDIQAIFDDPSNGISAPVLVLLNTQLANARLAWESDNFSLALSLLRDLIQLVIDNSGNGIPDTWDPPNTINSVAGEIRSTVRSLRFSLSLGGRPEGTEDSTFATVLEPGNDLSLEVILTFDGSADVDFDEDALGIDAEIIDPVDYLARLPAGVSIPADFPVLVTIDPEDGQSFSGTFSLEFRTEDLAFTGDSPLRLFKAEPGEMFEDFTRTYGLGSFRVLGTGGSFSEFLIVSDQRPVDQILLQKFDQAEDFLDDNDDDVPMAIRNAFDTIRAHWEANEIREAINAIDTFLQVVENNDDIPTIWLPDGSMINVGGVARSFAYSLRLSLVIKDNPPATQPGDVNQDGSVDVSDIFLLINQVFGGNVSLQ